MRVLFRVAAFLFLLNGFSSSIAFAQSGVLGLWVNSQGHCPLMFLYLDKNGQADAWEYIPGSEPDPVVPDYEGRWKMAGNRIDLRLNGLIADGRISLQGALAGGRLSTTFTAQGTGGAPNGSCLFTRKP